MSQEASTIYLEQVAPRGFATNSRRVLLCIDDGIAHTAAAADVLRMIPVLRETTLVTYRMIRVVRVFVFHRAIFSLLSQQGNTRYIHSFSRLCLTFEVIFVIFFAAASRKISWRTELTSRRLELTCQILTLN